jgi:uncharacterized protein YcbX
MVTGNDKNFKTARRFPHMTQINPVFEDDVLILKAPGKADIRIQLSSLSTLQKIEAK